MLQSPSILFVVPFTHGEARTFVQTLSAGFQNWNTAVMDSSITTLLFEAKKFDIVHFFLPASKAPHRLILKRWSSPVVQTFFTKADPITGYKNAIFSKNVVTFSEQEASKIRESFPGVKTDVILPCASMLGTSTMEASSEIRERYDAKDRLLVVALNDFDDHDHFSTFLYTTREYQRRGGFRFVIPLFKQEKQSLLWREHLQNAITQEKLSATVLLNQQVDIHSLLDASDIALHMDRRTSSRFAFPLLAATALCAGKPVISYNESPVGEFVGRFQDAWVAKAYEDFSRISRDLSKRANELEQICTEIARFARPELAIEAVAGRYQDLYKSISKL